MGISYLSDAVTGRCLGKEEEVIALVIRPTTGGYPDAVATVAKPATHSQDRFTAVSLVLHGHVGDYGDFVPHEDQTSLEMLLGAFKKDTWEAFSDEAFGYVSDGKGIALPRIKFNKDAPDEMAYLGVFVVAKSTYENIIATDFGSTSDEEIDTVIEMLVDANKRAKADDHSFYNAATFHGYSKDKYTFEDGREIDVPDLFNIMQDGKGWCELNYELKHSVDKVGVRSWGIQDDPDNEEFRKKIIALAEFQHLMCGLYVNDITLEPSSNGGQNRNAVRSATFQASNLVSTLEFIANREEFSTACRDELPKGIDELREKLEMAIKTIDEYKTRFDLGNSYRR